MADLIVCSNRGPYEYRRSGGDLVSKRGGGGLVNAVASVLDRLGGTWIAAAMSPGDHELAREEPAGRDEGGFHVRLLDLPAEQRQNHYGVVSNEHLWFVCHYLFDVAETPTFDGRFWRAWDDYRAVNHAFADAVAELRVPDAVLVEDYHLMLVAPRLRELGAPAPITYFHHTPWPQPDYLQLMPDAVVSELLRGLLACDAVGFHAARWARSFLACCDRFFEDAKVSDDEVVLDGRSTKVIVAPVPLDVARLREESDDERTQHWARRIEEQRRGRRMLARVDRIDLSKNPLRGYLAFEQLLERRPELAEDVWFLALQYPSRLSVDRYRRYFAHCLDAVRRINERFGDRAPGDEGPIGLHFEDDFNQSLAAMRVFDAILVNPVFDGLNLVAKEAAALNERDGVILLSRNAGAYEEIGEHVLTVDPFDVTATADAIERALELPADERAARASALRAASTRNVPEDWIRARLDAVGVSL